MKKNINFLEYDNKTMKLEYRKIKIISMKVIEVDKNDDYLVGHPKDGINSLENIKSNQFQELYDLIGLLDEKELKKNIHIRKYENLKKIVPINRIKNFVEQYGIPAISRDHFKVISKNSNYRIGFSLRRLRFWILDMHQAITLFAEIEKYKLESKKGIKKQIENNIFELAAKVPTFEKTDALSDIKEKLTNFIISDSLKINLIYDKKDDQYSFVNSTKDMLGAAGFQFLTILTKGITNEENQLKHKRCEYCGDLFWAEDGKQIYCDDRCNNKDYYHRSEKGKKMLKNGFTIDQVYEELNKKTRKSTIKRWAKK